MQVVFEGPTRAHIGKRGAKLIDVFFEDAANRGGNFDRDEGAVGGRHRINHRGRRGRDHEVTRTKIIRVFSWGANADWNHKVTRIKTNETTNSHECSRINNSNYCLGVS